MRGFVRCVVWRDLLEKAKELPETRCVGQDAPVAPAMPDIDEDSDTEPIAVESHSDFFFWIGEDSRRAAETETGYLQ